MKLRSKTNLMASAGRSKKGISGPVVASFLLPPAPLMRISKRPKAASTLSRAASTEVLSRTLQTTATALPPAFWMRSTTFWANSTFLLQIKHGNAGAGLGQTHGHCAAEHAAAAGDDNDFIGEVETVVGHGIPHAFVER